MNRSVFITLASLLCAAVTQAEPRTFTNTEGKSIKADLVRVEGENAVLKLANLSVAMTKYGFWLVSVLLLPVESFAKNSK